MSQAALTLLAERLCPWLLEPFEQLEAARRAGRLGSAWLISGPAGIGKLNLVLAFVRRLLDGGNGEPAVLTARDAAAAMRERRTPADHHPDLHLVFPEAEKHTIGIEQIRALSEVLSMKGFRGAAKAAVIEPAEGMTPAAANALLKTLEEPAEQTFLFLVTHQPERLLPTIRSRCQTLAVSPPSEHAAAEWLGLPPEHPVLQIAGRAPLYAAELVEQDKSKELSALESKLQDITYNRLDPRTVAEEWSRKDTELALKWLSERLERSIRLRYASARDSKSVTSGAADSLHNAWLGLPARTLFERLDAVERLLDRLGTGINVELALHALLADFKGERGRT